MAGPQVILASRSPQRRAILEQLGVDFEVRVPDVEEIEVGDPAVVARENALRKAVAVRAEGDAPVLAVDTVVHLDGELYGKPAGEQQAATTLRQLAGRTHEVVSGVALGREREMHTAVARTEVTFRALDDRWIAWYVGTGEWRERAGGYAIQGRGAAIVERIAGDYLNVVGLPVAALVDLWPELVAGTPGTS